MNEQIRDLLPNPFAVDYQAENAPLNLYTEKEMLKFAQMIISLTVLKVYNHPQLYKDPNYSFETLLEDIRKDFGVEE
jgi:hypothetical protein